MRFRFLLASVSMLAVTTQAMAEDAPPSSHDARSPDIIVTAPYERDRRDILTATSVVTGERLTRDLRPTIGETLARQPGVSATSFGPNASRPVLRGLQGERVRVLRDGIGSFDVSNTSVDHAVIINPLTADRIEVLRGPAALLYGSSAIGGVVNVIDSRIPRSIPDGGFHIDGIATYGSAAEERSLSGRTDVALGRFVVHVDGSWSKTSDLRIPGFVLTPALRAQALASPVDEIRDLAALRGRLPNSAARTWEVAGGAAYIGEGGNLGISFARYDSFYGLPVRYSLDQAVEAEQVRLSARQDRVDLRGEIDIAEGFFETIRLRAGFADYIHDEVEDTGAIGTTFLNKSIEGRLEFVQRQKGVWKGAWGLQLMVRDFNVIGAEAFVPKNETTQFGVFTLDTFDWGRFKGEFGLRYEKTRVTAEPGPLTADTRIARQFDTFSGSVGGTYEIADGLRLGLVFAHTERAPAAEELFANGPHKGTSAFEVGNPNFRVERSNGIEASLRGRGDGWSMTVAGYHNWFNNFIYETQTAAASPATDDLPRFEFFQAPARIWGLEAEASLRVAQFGDVAVKIDGVADYTRATLRGAGPVPRIPPLRLLGGIEAAWDKFTARAEVEWSDKQTRIAAFETATPSFTHVNASLAFHPFGKDNPTSVIASANNIFDVEARRHASFLKDYAPLAGRDFRITARFAL